jgi:hypothetical protein
VQNIQQFVNGDYDVAFSLADTAADAVNGKGSFNGKPQKIQALARTYPNSVRADAGINSIADMRGKRISTGSPKSGTEVIANRLLQAAGLDPATDVQAQRLDLAKTSDGMKSGNIDGLVWSGGLPTAQITDITTSLKGQVKFLDITPQLDALKKVNRVYDTGDPCRQLRAAGGYADDRGAQRAARVRGLPGRQRLRHHQVDLRQVGGTGECAPRGQADRQADRDEDRPGAAAPRRQAGPRLGPPVSHRHQSRRFASG